MICRPCVRTRQQGYDKGRCPERTKAAQDKYLRTKPERQAANRRKWKFGMDSAAVEAMLASQGGACALCHRAFTGETFIDHDHRCCPDKAKRTCGKCVRAVLCRKCNQGLGFFNDDPDLLVAAAAYVIAHQKSGTPAA